MSRKFKEDLKSLKESLHLDKLKIKWKSLDDDFPSDDIELCLQKMTCLEIRNSEECEVNGRMCKINKYMIGSAQAHRLFYSFDENSAFDPIADQTNFKLNSLRKRIDEWENPSDSVLCGHFFVSDKIREIDIENRVLKLELAKQGCFPLFDNHIVQDSLSAFKERGCAFFVRNHMASFALTKHYLDKRDKIRGRRNELVAKYYGLWTLTYANVPEGLNYHLVVTARSFEDLFVIFPALHLPKEIPEEKQESSNSSSTQEPKNVIHVKSANKKDLVLIVFNRGSYLTDRFLYRIANDPNISEYYYVTCTKNEHKTLRTEDEWNKSVSGKENRLTDECCIDDLKEPSNATAWSFALSACGALKTSDEPKRTVYLLNVPVPAEQDSSIEIYRRSTARMPLFHLAELVNNCVKEARNQVLDKIEGLGDVRSWRLPRNYDPNTTTTLDIPQRSRDPSEPIGADSVSVMMMDAPPAAKPRTIPQEPPIVNENPAPPPSLSPIIVLGQDNEVRSSRCSPC